MVTFSLVLTCLVRDIKERVVLARTYKHHLIGVIASAVGLTALHTCTIGAPVCASAFFFTSLFAFFPFFLTKFLTKYSVFLIVFSIIVQLLTLYLIGCFKKVK